jgi:hypothetical protein
MATITLYREEFEEAVLPPSCMRCGAPATLAKEKMFFWGPNWLLTLLLVGLVCFGPLFWIAIILNLILLKRMRIPVTLCERHRNHWLLLQVLLFGGIGILALLSFTTVVLVVTTRGPRDPQGELVIGIGVATVVVLLAVVFPAAILQTRVIRPTEITKDSITLIGVADVYVCMVLQERQHMSGGSNEEAVTVVRCPHCRIIDPALSSRGFCLHCQLDVNDPSPAPPAKRAWWRFWA